MPLQTVDKLMSMGQSCDVDDVEVVNASLDENEHNIKTGQVVLSPEGNQIHTELSGNEKDAIINSNGGHAAQPNDEDDYEDMMTPTDDEGITSLNHT